MTVTDERWGRLTVLGALVAGTGTVLPWASVRVGGAGTGTVSGMAYNGAVVLVSAAVMLGLLSWAERRDEPAYPALGCFLLAVVCLGIVGMGALSIQEQSSLRTGVDEEDVSSPELKRAIDIAERENTDVFPLDVSLGYGLYTSLLGSVVVLIASTGGFTSWDRGGV